jgi:hypothetical protein
LPHLLLQWAVVEVVLKHQMEMLAALVEVLVLVQVELLVLQLQGKVLLVV